MSISKKLFILSFSVISLALLLIPTSQVYAQTQPAKALDLTVSPVFFEFQAKPGDTLSNTLRLRNNTSETIQIKAEIKKIGGDDNGDLAIKDTTADETLSWIEIKNKSFTTQPKEWTTIPFTITVPKNAAYGYYWALSFTTDENQDVKNFAGAKVNASVVVPILLNVNKAGAKTDAKILDFKKDAGWYEYLPVKFMTTIENLGNVHISPKGNIFIKDWKGKQIAELPLNPGQGNIIPNLKKTFESSWNQSFITIEPKFEENGKAVLDKNGNQKKGIVFHFDKVLDFRIGKYTATAVVVVSGEKQDLAYEKSISFFVFPWKIVIGAIIFIVFALLGFASTTKSIVKRIKKLFGKGKDKE